MTVRKIETTGPKKWEADVYPPGHGGGNRTRRRFKTKKEAEAFEADLIRQHSEGRGVDDRAAKSTTVGELWSQFRDHVADHGIRGGKKPKPRTLSNYDFKYRTYIAPEWKHTPLAAVSRDRCERWLPEMVNAAGGSASNDAKKDGAGLFKNLLDFGLNRGLLSYNPMKDRAGDVLSIPAPEPARANVYLTLRQLIRLSSLCGKAELLVLTAGLTGLRLSELTGLTVDDVDLGESPNVFVPVERSKTSEARTVPLPDQIADRFRKNGVGWREGSAPALPAARGGPWSHSYLGKVFRPVADRASLAIHDLQAALEMEPEYISIEFGGSRRRIAIYGERTERTVIECQNANGLKPTGVTDEALWDTLGLAELSPMRLWFDADSEPDRDMPDRPIFHDLRHTTVSLAIQAGVSIKMVQKMAGHKSAMVTLDVYGHLYPEETDTAAAAMTELLAASLPTDHLETATSQ